MSYLKLPQLNLMTPILARDSTCLSVRGNKTEYKNLGIEYCSSRQPRSTEQKYNLYCDIPRASQIA